MSRDDAGREAIVVLPFDSVADAQLAAAMLRQEGGDGHGWGAIAVTDARVVALVREHIRAATRKGRAP